MFVGGMLKIDKQPVSPKRRLFGTKKETVMYLFSSCPELVQKQYKRQKSILGIVQEAEISHRWYDWLCIVPLSKADIGTKQVFFSIKP